MDTDSSPVDGGNSGGSTPPNGFKAPQSQEELNRIIAERLARERAKYADYDELKHAAAKLKAIEDAQKSESERMAEAKAALERERDQAKAEALRLRIAAKHGISDEDADLFLTATDEATLERQATRLAATTKKTGNYVPREGQSVRPAAGGEREFLRQLFGREG